MAAPKTEIQLIGSTVNLAPRMSHWQVLYPTGRDDEAVALLRGAVELRTAPAGQFLRAEQGATILELPLGEESVRALAERLAEAVRILDANRKDRAH